jgi:hypothetical protein
LNSAAQLLDECPDGEAVEMLDDMTESARDILRCLLEIKKKLAAGN